MLSICYRFGLHCPEETAEGFSAHARSQTGSYLSCCSAVILATVAGNGRGVWSQLEQVAELGIGICLVLEIDWEFYPGLLFEKNTKD